MQVEFCNEVYVEFGPRSIRTQLDFEQLVARMNVLLGPARICTWPETLPGLMMGSIRPSCTVPQFMRQKASAPCHSRVLYKKSVALISKMVNNA